MWRQKKRSIFEIEDSEIRPLSCPGEREEKLYVRPSPALPPQNYATVVSGN